MMKRRKNKQDDFEPEQNEQTLYPRNIFPITSLIYIQDEHKGLRMALITDRAQGATSLDKGSISINIERKAKFDNRGLNE